MQGRVRGSRRNTGDSCESLASGRACLRSFRSAAPFSSAGTVRPDAPRARRAAHRVSSSLATRFRRKKRALGSRPRALGFRPRTGVQKTSGPTARAAQPQARAVSFLVARRQQHVAASNIENGVIRAPRRAQLRRRAPRARRRASAVVSTPYPLPACGPRAARPTLDELDAGPAHQPRPEKAGSSRSAPTASHGQHRRRCADVGDRTGVKIVLDAIATSRTVRTRQPADHGQMNMPDGNEDRSAHHDDLAARTAPALP